MKKAIRIITIVLFSLILTVTFSYAEDWVKVPVDPSVKKESHNEFLKAMYGELSSIKLFADNKVRELGSAEKIGLNEKELTEYLRLRFKNSFVGVEHKTIVGHPITEVAKMDLPKNKAIGQLIIEVWTVGDDYPIAFHIKLTAGNLDENIYEDSTLGYGSKNNVPHTVRETISDMVDRFAIIFFKVRGEL